MGVGEVRPIAKNEAGGGPTQIKCFGGGGDHNFGVVG